MWLTQIGMSCHPIPAAPRHDNLLSSPCVFFQLVLWSVRLPQILEAQHRQWGADGSHLLPGADRRDACVLQPHVRGLRHRGLLPGSVWWPWGLDLLQLLFGHHERHVDAQDCTWLLQGVTLRPQAQGPTPGERQGRLMHEDAEASFLSTSECSFGWDDWEETLASSQCTRCFFYDSFGFSSGLTSLAWGPVFTAVRLESAFWHWHAKALNLREPLSPQVLSPLSAILSVHGQVLKCFVVFFFFSFCAFRNGSWQLWPLCFLMARTKEQHSVKHYTLSRDSWDNGVWFTLWNEVVSASVASFFYSCYGCLIHWNWF